ncbi:MAG: RNA polymerase sigma factor [Planctomycetaceae bacterium]
MSDSQSTESHDKNLTSPSLIAALREKNPDAWNRMVELYAPTVVQWCRHMKLGEQEIPDVLQEVFQVVATRLHQFRRNRQTDTFRGWLRTVTRNKVIDHFRARDRQLIGAGGTEAQSRMADVPDIGDAENDDASGEVIETALFQRALTLIQEHFEERTWRAFWLTVVEGRATADVASELEMKPGTVRVAKSRVLSRLRHELGDVE